MSATELAETSEQTVTGDVAPAEDDGLGFMDEDTDDQAGARAGAGAPQAGVTLLGYTASWSVGGLLVDRQALGDALTAVGLGQYLPKRPPTAKRALRRAIYAWANRRAGGAVFAEDDLREANGRKTLIREIKARADERGTLPPIVYALVEELSLGQRLGLQYAMQYRFRYDPNTPQAGAEATNTGRLTVLMAAQGLGDSGVERERERVLAEITPVWEQHKSLYNGADISNLLIEIVRDASGISVESGSGVWFLPVRAGQRIDQLERLVGLISPGGGDAHFRVHENIDWPRTRRAIADAALDDLLAEVREQAGRMEGYEASNRANPGSVKPTTMAGFVDNLLGIQRKAKVYVETVGLRDERVERELSAVGMRAVVLNRENRELRQERMEALRAPRATADAATVGTEMREERV